MSSIDPESLTSEKLLSGGLGLGRRASTLLFAIESRVAQLVAHSQQATATYLTGKEIEQRERAFLQAFAAGRELPLQPTIQDFERYVPHWRDLVPAADPRLKAALARAMGNKYTFTMQAIPGIRAALGLEEAATQNEFQRLYREPLSTIYAPEVTPRERFRWASAKVASTLESLPPFWVAFGLTLPLGAGLLALPIAVAQIGVGGGLILLILFGLVNMLTAAALAETVSRSGTTRFGLGFLGQLASEYLGNAGSVLMTVALFANMFLVLIVFYIGVTGTLEDTTGLPAELWIASLFGVSLYFLSRKNLNTTVASALVITTINVAIIIVIPVFALPYIRLENLTGTQLSSGAGNGFDPAILQLILGVMLSNYFSHMLIANYGRTVLRRDPSAHSWIWGCIAAIAVTTIVSCIWVLTFNGAVPPDLLASETGTALTALSRLVGPVVLQLGTVIVVLNLGMACIHISLGLLFTVEERLPVPGDGRMGRNVRFLISVSPVLSVFLISEWLSINSTVSYAKLLAIFAGITLPLLGGIFPLLLLTAARRKGDFVPGLNLRILGNRTILVGIYLLFLGSIFAYGLFIWDGIIERVVTLLVGIFILIVTVIIFRRGALNPRLVVELRGDFSHGGQHQFNVTACGEPMVIDARLNYKNHQQQIQAGHGNIPAFDALQSVIFQLPASNAHELKVWIHKITPEERSQPLAARLTVRAGEEVSEFNLNDSAGQVLLPIDSKPYQLEITLERD
jgi:amino acid permease